MDIKRTAGGLVAATLTAAAVVAVPVYAHHSFSIFDASQTKTFTGVVTRVNPDANHLQIFFAVMNEEYAKVFGDEPPARSAVAVHQLPLGALVEIEAWVHLPGP